MNTSTIKDMQEAQTALETTYSVLDADPLDPVKAVELSLVHLLQHRIKKLEDDVKYEEDIKNAIITRLSEASFVDLVEALRIQQTTTNTSIEKVLSPFVPRMTASREKTSNNSNPNENIHDNINKDTISALEELRKAVLIIKDENKNKEDPSSSSASDSIKKSIGL